MLSNYLKKAIDVFPKISGTTTKEIYRTRIRKQIKKGLKDLLHVFYNIDPYTENNNMLERKLRKPIVDPKLMDEVCRFWLTIRGYQYFYIPEREKIKHDDYYIEDPLSFILDYLESTAYREKIKIKKPHYKDQICMKFFNNSFKNIENKLYHHSKDHEFKNNTEFSNWVSCDNFGCNKLDFYKTE